LQEAYEYEMDQRMIDVMDPTNFGADTVFAVDEKEAAAVEEKIEEGVSVKGEKKSHHPHTIFTEDVEWGDRGHG